MMQRRLVVCSLIAYAATSLVTMPHSVRWDRKPCAVEGRERVRFCHLSPANPAGASTSTHLLLLNPCHRCATAIAALTIVLVGEACRRWLCRPKPPGAEKPKGKGRRQRHWRNPHSVLFPRRCCGGRQPAANATCRVTPAASDVPPQQAPPQHKPSLPAPTRKPASTTGPMPPLPPLPALTNLWCAHHTRPPPHLLDQKPTC